MKKRPSINIDKSGHILTLDQTWHQLFDDHKSLKISNLENQLNKLLKQQGKANTEYGDYQALKKKLLAEIVAHMDESSSGDMEALKLTAKNQKYVNDINKKLAHYEKQKTELPHEIDRLNKSLLEESMFICYKLLLSSKENKEGLELEIDAMRDQLLKKVADKEKMDREIAKLYNFMHDIAGIEVIEQLDRFYFGGEE